MFHVFWVVAIVDVYFWQKKKNPFSCLYDNFSFSLWSHYVMYILKCITLQIVKNLSNVATVEVCFCNKLVLKVCGLDTQSRHNSRCFKYALFCMCSKSVTFVVSCWCWIRWLIYKGTLLWLIIFSKRETRYMSLQRQATWPALHVHSREADRKKT